MKIIEKKDFADWKHQFNCSKCDSKLEAEHEDVKCIKHAAWSDPRDGSGGPETYTYYVECAVCCARYDIPDNHLPKTLQLEVQKRTTRAQVSSYYGR